MRVKSQKKKSGLPLCTVCQKETARDFMSSIRGKRACLFCVRQREQDLKEGRIDPVSEGSKVALALLALLAGAIWYFWADVGPIFTKFMAKMGQGQGSAREDGSQDSNSPPAPGAAPTATSAADAKKTVVLNFRSDVLFEFGKASLKPAAASALQEAAKLIRQRPGASVVIRGYTDSVGSEPANLALSRQRAEGVKDWLVKAGVPAKQLSTVGMGTKEPLAANTKPDGSDNPAGREQNRRVTVAISGG